VRRRLSISRDRDVEYGAALALAVAGDSSAAEALANDLVRRFPEDSLARFNYLPVLRARIALNRRDPSGALEYLQAALPYELGMTWTWFGALYPIYIRGETYLALQQGAKAAAEFQKVLEHSGLVMADPIGALSRLQRGRALALARDRTKAKVAYADFLALWKEADPDTRIFRQARAEYTKLP
jgi:predicted Zn-dependent protease